MHSKKRKLLLATSILLWVGLLVLAFEDSAVEAKSADRLSYSNGLRHRVAALEERVIWLKRALRAEKRMRRAGDARLQAQIDAIRQGCCDVPLNPCDVSDLDFGPCDAVLGWGGIDGQCQEISGCESPVPLFESQQACERECSCRDRSGVDFGPCEALLGYAIIDGECTAIAGCPPSPVPLFSSLAECSGVCIGSCGGIAGLTCPDDRTCIDDPSDNCDPACNGADCVGICLLTDPDMSSCGGFAGIPCPDGFTCVDDPGDPCSPSCGGADCPGICVQD